MKRFVISEFITALITMVSCNGTSNSYESVEVPEFKSIIADTAVTVVDVRNAEEYSDGYIAGACNIDVQEEDFLTKADSLLSKEKTIAVYCRSGRRSKKAAEILSNNGYKVVELNSGFLGWIEAGEDIDMEPECGSYTLPRKPKKDELELFQQTYKGETKLTPVFVSLQVVAGMNYRFSCSDKDGKEYEVVIYQPLPGQGDPRVTSVERQ